MEFVWQQLVSQTELQVALKWGRELPQVGFFWERGKLRLSPPSRRLVTYVKRLAAPKKPAPVVYVMKEEKIMQFHQKSIIRLNRDGSARMSIVIHKS